jgi:hypothetical protein
MGEPTSPSLRSSICQVLLRFHKSRHLATHQRRNTFFDQESTSGTDIFLVRFHLRLFLISLRYLPTAHVRVEGKIESRDVNAVVLGLLFLVFAFLLLLTLFLLGVLSRRQYKCTCSIWMAKLTPPSVFSASSLDSRRLLNSLLTYSRIFSFQKASTSSGLRTAIL